MQAEESKVYHLFTYLISTEGKLVYHTVSIIQDENDIVQAISLVYEKHKTAIIPIMWHKITGRQCDNYNKFDKKLALKLVK